MSKRFLFWAIILVFFFSAIVLMTQSKDRINIKKETREENKQITKEFLSSEILTVVPVKLKKTLNLSGTLRSYSMASIKARLSGEIKEILVREGEKVKQNQILVKMDSSEYLARLAQAEGNYNSSKAQLEIAANTHENNKKLEKKGFISQNALENSLSEYNFAKAKLASTKGSLDLAKKILKDTEILAPISGVVSYRNAQPGEKVSPDNKLLEIVNLKKLELVVAVQTKHLKNIFINQEVKIKVDGINKFFSGKVVRVNPSTQKGSRSILIFVEILNKNNLLKVGMFAEVELILQSKNHKVNLK